MSDLTCPMCGHPVRVMSSDEGTNSYEPVERAARAEPGLREALTSVRGILDKHILRLGRYYRSSHIETFAREAIAEIDAALEAHGEPQEGKR